MQQRTLSKPYDPPGALHDRTMQACRVLQVPRGPGLRSCAASGGGRLPGAQEGVPSTGLGLGEPGQRIKQVVSLCPSRLVPAAFSPLRRPAPSLGELSGCEDTCGVFILPAAGRPAWMFQILGAFKDGSCQQCYPLRTSKSISGFCSEHLPDMWKVKIQISTFQITNVGQQ